jgi:hypothetical protein
MSRDLERAGRKLFLVENRRGQQAAPQAVSQAVLKMRCADKSPCTDFPIEPAQVGVINVDRAGKDVPLSSQEGI